MPNPDSPEITAWVDFLKDKVGSVDKNTYFVGHSIGCQTILRLLERQDGKTGGCVFVAGWFHLIGLEEEGEEAIKIAAPWLEISIDFDNVKNKIDKSVAIFSDNDPFVPLSDKDIFSQAIGSKIIVEHDKGHFDEGNDIKELPVARESLFEIMQ
jgi:uncharacterized protein